MHTACAANERLRGTYSKGAALDRLHCVGMYTSEVLYSKDNMLHHQWPYCTCHLQPFVPTVSSCVCVLLSCCRWSRYCPRQSIPPQSGYTWTRCGWDPSTHTHTHTHTHTTHTHAHTHTHTHTHRHTHTHTQRHTHTHTGVIYVCAYVCYLLTYSS